jgi:uncharacterized protein YndB with AHSA1/START domain
MEKKKSKTITVGTTVKAPVEKVWACWTQPDHITKWYYAAASWHAPSATNHLKVDGRPFLITSKNTPNQNIE